MFATNLISENEVDFSANAVDLNLSTEANIRASSGIALGIGAYSGHLEIQYPMGLDANTTSYLKIDTEEDLLPSLLGGSLGGLLADISGSLLIGNQEFSLEAKNGNDLILEGHSNVLGDFGTNNLGVVVNGNNDYFIAVTPDQSYDGLRLTNRVGSLLGLNNVRTLSVSGGFSTQGNNACGTPGYTSFDGSGLTLDLLNLGGAGVTNPNLAIDADSATFSQLGLGIIGVAAEIEQTVYFDTPSYSNDNVYVQLAIDPSLLQLGIANNIEIIAQNGSNTPVFSGSLASLLNFDFIGNIARQRYCDNRFLPPVPRSPGLRSAYLPY